MVRRYRYQVSKGDLHFEIVLWATNNNHAADLATEIGFKLHLLLEGPL